MIWGNHRPITDTQMQHFNGGGPIVGSRVSFVVVLFPNGNQLALFNNISLRGRPRWSPHLSEHGGQVPHAAHDGPAAHHPQQVADHAVLAAVPEGISETGIILRHWKTKHY